MSYLQPSLHLISQLPLRKICTTSASSNVSFPFRSFPACFKPVAIKDPIVEGTLFAIAFPAANNSFPASAIEMAGFSISLLKLDDELKEYIDHPVDTPFFKQV